MSRMRVEFERVSKMMSIHTCACLGCGINSYIPPNLRFIGAGLVCAHCYTEQYILAIRVPIAEPIQVQRLDPRLMPPPSLASALTPPMVEEEPWWLTGLKFVGLATGTVVTAAVVFRGLRALLDHDFGGRVYPEPYCRKLIQEHLDQYGAHCNGCSRRVPISNLTVDHQFPHARGGATSTWNSDVLCQPCNSRKGVRTGLMVDLFLS